MRELIKNLKGITKFLFPEVFANYLYNSEKMSGISLYVKLYVKVFYLFISMIYFNEGVVCGFS